MTDTCPSCGAPAERNVTNEWKPQYTYTTPALYPAERAVVEAAVARYEAEHAYYRTWRSWLPPLSVRAAWEHYTGPAGRKYDLAMEALLAARAAATEAT